MLRRLPPLALAPVVAVLAWPATDPVARTGLDPSWQLAGTFAHVERLRYGDDIVFNYGPLGFVVAPVAGGGRWFHFGVLGLAALVVVLAMAVFAALRLQRIAVPAAVAITAALLLLAPTGTSLPELVVLAVGLMVVLTRWHDVAFHPAAWAGLAALAASLTLVKISTGPVLLVVVLLAALLDDRRGRALAITAGAYGVALLGWWVVLGQSFGDLGGWLRGALEIGLGHTAAMSIGTPGGPWQYAALVTVLGGSGVVFVAAVGRNRSPLVFGCVAMVAILGWFLVKQGFVRRDGHAGVFFFEAFLALVVLVPWARLSRPLVAASGSLGAVALVAFLVIDTRSIDRLVNPIRPVVDVAETAELLVSSGARADADRAANRVARAEYAVPQAVLDAIGDEPVHVDPWEITLAWSAGLDWRPIPTLQNYLGYTDHLDRRNADALTAPDGPRFVLRTPHGPIDGRFAPLDGPAYHVALLCNYETVVVDRDWQLFERSAPRCAPPVPRSTVELAAGEFVELPAVDASTAVLVSVDHRPGMLARAASLVLKPPSTPQLLLDDRSYRMIPATAATPGLVVVPAAANWRIAPAEPPARVGVDRSATVSIFTMEVASEPQPDDPEQE